MSNIVQFKKRLYRAKEVQQIFNVDRSTLNSWIRQGILQKYKKIGRLLYFDCDEVNSLATIGG